MKTRDLILISLFTALTAVGAFIRIPVPVCPFTLQLLFTTMAGLLLGARKGAVAVLSYVLLGLAGLPVFTGGRRYQLRFPAHLRLPHRLYSRSLHNRCNCTQWRSYHETSADRLLSGTCGGLRSGYAVLLAHKPLLAGRTHRYCPAFPILLRTGSSRGYMPVHTGFRTGEEASSRNQ